MNFKDIDAITSLLSTFFEKNPESKLEEVENEGDQKKDIHLVSPWGDTTLVVILPNEEKECLLLIEALNSVWLPNKFSAIMHNEDRIMEVVWTAYSLRTTAAEIANRNFNFEWNGQVRKCEYKEASSELLKIAGNCFPVSNSSNTEHRNIISFHLYANNVKHQRLDRPMCFWVDCDGIEDRELTEYFLHLNAYMSYFDRLSPRVLIHKDLPKKHKKLERYVNGKFPDSLSARKLDPNILSFWCEAIGASDEIMRFLLYYRILEYCAFTHIEHSARQEVTRELMRPDLTSNMEDVQASISEIFAKNRAVDSIQRTQTFISATVQHKLLWDAIELNHDFFKKDVVFEGGFKVNALLSNKCDFENWKPNGVRNTLDRLRVIRNALSHGQDGSTRGAIRPGSENSQKLVPWINLIEIIAGEAMLYSELA
ncbi:MAG: hypothetical protein JKX71_11250 [Amylibacter sp.]|nr:hypothetical protein [Amylibacter sp.]